jgi:hypothetical protein
MRPGRPWVLRRSLSMPATRGADLGTVRNTLDSGVGTSNWLGSSMSHCNREPRIGVLRRPTAIAAKLLFPCSRGAAAKGRKLHRVNARLRPKADLQENGGDRYGRRSRPRCSDAATYQ